MNCSKCNSANACFSKKKNCYVCEDCGAEFGYCNEQTVFVSYGHDDHERLVKEISKKLDGYPEIKVWVDYDCLYGSSEWETKIEDGIKTSKYVIVFITEHAMRRPDGYCHDEICYARNFGKSILPIKVQNITPPISIARLQWIDMGDYLNSDGSINEEKVNKCVEEIVQIVKGLKEIAFNDTRNYLIDMLKPLDNESFLSSNKNFYGRKWLFDIYDNWLNEDSSRVLCIVGQAGSGKSAFVSKLCEYSSNVTGIHFCKYNNSERADPKRAITSLAFHLSTQIPRYKEELLKLADLDKLYEKSTSRLFEYLFIEPLSKIKVDDKKYVLIIDALDEATNGMKNELVNLIGKEFDKTPSWLKFVVTTRPEYNITRNLQHLNPFVIKNDSNENLEDIYGYLYENLKDYKTDDEEYEQIIKKILGKSEGTFLYAVEIVKAIRNNTLSLRNIDNFPVGMISIYAEYFARLFPDSGKYDYRRTVRPLMEVLCYCLEPIDIDTVAEIIELDDYDAEELYDYITVLFPTVNRHIEPIHKSLVDWLRDRSLSGSYGVSFKIGNKRIAYWYYTRYKQRSNDEYATKYLSKHLIYAGETDAATETLTDSDYLAARIHLISQDTAIRGYIEELGELHKSDKDACKKILLSPCFINMFKNNRRYLYNAALYFDLKDMGFDEVIDDYLAKDDIVITTGCVNYLYINEDYEKTIELATSQCEKYSAGGDKTAYLCELENEIALSYRKLVDFDSALVHSRKVCDIYDNNHDFYELALAHQTIGKILYHRKEWDEAYKYLCKAISLLEDSLKNAKSDDYIKMLTLYVAAFEREVALSLVWQRNTDLARKHLGHAGEIYNKLHSYDRYYVRYLYVGMFADILDGKLEGLHSTYEYARKFALSKYDKSQLEFYYCFGLLLLNEKGLLDEHLKIAKENALKIDAYIERNEILMFENMISGKKDEFESLEHMDNDDIRNWINFVNGFVKNL